jgi:hypothetical protein
MALAEQSLPPSVKSGYQGQYLDSTAPPDACSYRGLSPRELTMEDM